MIGALITTQNSLNLAKGQNQWDKENLWCIVGFGSLCLIPCTKAGKGSTSDSASVPSQALGRISQLLTSPRLRCVRQLTRSGSQRIYLKFCVALVAEPYSTRKKKDSQYSFVYFLLEYGSEYFESLDDRLQTN